LCFCLANVFAEAIFANKVHFYASTFCAQYSLLLEHLMFSRCPNVCPMETSAEWAVMISTLAIGQHSVYAGEYIPCQRGLACLACSADRWASSYPCKNGKVHWAGKSLYWCCCRHQMTTGGLLLSTVVYIVVICWWSAETGSHRSVVALLTFAWLTTISKGRRNGYKWHKCNMSPSSDVNVSISRIIARDNSSWLC